MKFSILSPFDAHVHFRDGAMMEAVVPHTARHFGRALVMPNVPAIETADRACEYYNAIRKVGGPEFHPLMTIKLTARTTPAMIRDAGRYAYIVAAKLYPRGATTASHDGIEDVEALVPVLAEMQRVGMVLCIHGEEPSAFVLDREAKYLGKVAWIVRNFPGLRVVLEHITTDAAVRFVADASVNVAATITAHHLMLTLDDVLGDGIRPHNFCYPVPKTPDDRDALRCAARRSDGGKFFLGTDSAPHARSAKESACGCAGVFSAPVALACLATFFRISTGPLGLAYQMDQFCSVVGAKFYGLEPSANRITIREENWEVPDEIDGVVPFMAGKTLGWKVEG